MSLASQPRVLRFDGLALARAATPAPVRLDQPGTWVGHIPFTTWLLSVLKPRTMVVLGVHFGTLYLNSCHAVDFYQAGTKCFGIDLWQSEPHSDLDSDAVFSDVEQYNRVHFSGFSRLIRTTFDEAASSFDDGQIDLLHIGAAHTYDGVKHDFETWLPKLSPTAVVFFHNTNVRETDFGVWRFWLELQERYQRHLEFKHGHGLGVLQIGAPAVEDLLWWLCPDAPEREQVLGLLTDRGREVESRHWALLAQRSVADHLAATQQASAADLAPSHLELPECQQELAAVRQTLLDHQHKVVAAQRLVAYCQVERSKAERELEAAAQVARRLDAVLTSTSWRITRPLRAAVGLLRRGAAYFDFQAARLATRRQPPYATPSAGRAGRGSLGQPPAVASGGKVSTVQLESSPQPAPGTPQTTPQRPASLLDLLEEQEREIERLRNDVAAIHRSTSWQLTWPIRVAAELGRRARDRVNWVFRATGRRVAALNRNVLPMPARPTALAAIALPLRAGGGIVQADSFRYILVDGPTHYCYLEPRPPRDVARLLSDLAEAPCFSIVVPVYNPPAEFLERAVGSIVGQWYPRWQLILVDDASTSAAAIAALAHFKDPRISVNRLQRNLGISGATNHGLQQVTGDWVVFMDHDDELTPDCLYELAQCIAAQNPDFIYSDEDKISERGLFIEPHFKPDWSPDTMMSTMFTGHVSAVRAELLRAVGPLRSEVDGCQDWDLVLRIAEVTSRIAHIPKVLYHWRCAPGSIAADLGAKEYVRAASRRVREDALTRRGLVGEVEEVPSAPGYLRVNYLPRKDPLVSIVIPTRDNPGMLARCIDSIIAFTAGIRFEVVILDNGSTTAEARSLLRNLALLTAVSVVRHEAPFNYSELNNLGSRVANGTLLLFLNDDTEVVQSDWLARLVGFAQLSHVGAVGAKLIYPASRRVQHLGVVNSANGPGHAFLGREEHHQGYFMRGALEYNWIAVTGACLVISREKFEMVGGFCEAFPIAYNDIDLCFRLRDAGFWTVCVPAVTLLHHESATRGHDGADPIKMRRLAGERRVLYSRHPSYFQFDPFFNPNLHPTDVHFELAL